jgi:uncharacterized protein YkwD
MKGVVACMRASSASGRGNPRIARRPAKVIRIPTATLVRRRRMLRLTVAIGAALLFASIIVRLQRITAPLAIPEPPHAKLNPIESRIVELVNDARAAAGAAPLVLSDRLGIAARVHADDMAANGYLAHDSTAGDTPADRVHAAGLDYDEIAENLLIDQGHDLDALPRRALATWLASPASRVNLLAPRFRTAAVAIAHATDGSYYVTLDLMR